MSSNNIKRIKYLTEYLNKCRGEYYNDSNPSISDAEYDKLFDELAELEKKEQFIVANSPTQTVGYTVNEKLAKVKHKIPLLSLDKTKDFSVAKNFTGNYLAVLMHKLDGLTICLEYDDGKLIRASTRGNGEEGSLITDNVKTFVNVPLTISHLNRLVVTGEGIILKDDFDKINSKLPEGEKYKTPRNLASGSIQQLDSGICATRKVRFFAFNVVEGATYDSLSNELSYLSNLGFDVCRNILFSPQDVDNKYFDDLVQKMVGEAISNNIPIDGLVIKYNNIKYGKSLGRTGHHYKDGIALKFQEEQEESVITDIEWQVGRTGKITPVAIFNPVELDGTTVSKASLHNISIMNKIGIKKDAKITVVKKNEIIPQIIKSEGGICDFKTPSTCPVCGGKVVIKEENGVITPYCDNPDCVAKNIASLSYFVSKDCMDIDGLSEKTLEKFVEAGLIHNIYDIYQLYTHRSTIIEFDGMGENSFENLVNSIEESRNVRLANFIAALGIPKIALSKAKILEKYFGTWENFKDAVDNDFDFSQIETFGVELNKNIHEFFNNKFNANDYYFELAAIMYFEENETSENKLDGLIFCITGSLNNFSRKELQEYIENNGGKVSGSVSKKTSYLINNDTESKSSKNESAKKNGVKIISEQEFIDMFKQ